MIDSEYKIGQKILMQQYEKFIYIVSQHILTNL